MSGDQRLAGDAALDAVITSKSLSESELLRLCLVGGCTLLFDGPVIAVKSRKALALFSYLAWNAPKSETRERLAGLLWSESDEESARASLRQTLKQLRSALEGAGFRGLYGDRLELRLDANLLHVDVRAAMDALKAGQVSEELYRTKRMTDAILTGFEDVDPMFRSWLVVQRQVVQDQLVSSLEGLLSDDPDLQSENSRDVAQALANIDPSNETACRALMGYHAKAGDIAASLRCYNDLWRLLDEEFDMAPSNETQDLAAQIKSGSFESALPAVATPTPEVSTPAERRLVISVGTFETPNVPTELRYLIQGMRADLIARLVRFREWSVCEGENEERLGDVSQPSQSHLDVYDVDATAFPEGERVRLVLTLKDRTQQHFIWSDWFHLDVDRWHDTQSAVVRRLAIAMNVHLSAERLARIAAAPDVKPRLYDRWLLGQELSFRWSPDTEVQAESIFQDIIREAPDFAPAYSSLVQIINSRHLIFPGIFRSQGREQETLALAKTAVMIDPLDSRTHLCLAWSNAMNAYFSRAGLSFRLASDLNENDPWSLVSASLGLAFCDEMDLAHTLADRALHVGLGASRLHWGYQTCVRFLEEDYESAVEAADQAQDMMLGLPAWKAAALFHLGRRAEAKAEGQRFLALVRSRWQGEEPPTDDNIARWFMHLYPIRRQQQWERLREGLSGAGVPVPKAQDFQYRQG